MEAPLYSTITLFAELAISAAIYFIIYQAYTKNIFYKWLAWVALTYEVLFNMSYMASRATHHITEEHSSIGIIFAIVHGTLSLIMFLALVVFFILASRAYLKGENYFRKHSLATALFLIFWTFSILSGVLFYVIEYVV